MSKLKALEVVTRAAGKVKLAAVKHAPEIFVISGTALVVAGFVTGCMATTKAHEVAESYTTTKEEIEAVKRLVEAGEVSAERYTEQDYKRDRVVAVTNMVVGYVKLYALPVGLTVTGVAFFLAAYGILHKRNAALMAAYNALDASFKAYRERVIADQGDEADKKYMYGGDSATMKAVSTKDGNAVVTTIEGAQLTPSPYARFFDESCEEWTKSPEANLDTLIVRQNWCNDKLRAQRHLFLNEVYDYLGMERSQIGNIVGWIYDPKHGKDNYVDFGIYDIHNPEKRRFVNGLERTILLDFNVDGVILNKLKDREREAMLC